MNKQKDFQVALLMDDITEAQELSIAFREIGIYAHFYQTLGELWVDAKTRTPDLTIVDVKKMSDGEVLFQNHPKVKKDSMCFAFYYKEESKMLLNSTYNLNHYGYVKKEISLGGQIQTILRLRNKELFLKDENGELSQRIERIQKRTKVLSAQAEKSFQYEDVHSLMDEFFKGLGTSTDVKSFCRNLTQAFNAWEYCYSFSVYKLSKNFQKLTSLDKTGPKFRVLPDLWLNVPCNEGIKGYARDMAEDVSRDYLLNSIRGVEVKGRFENGDLLVLGNFDEKRLQAFDWDLFGERISNLYRTALVNDLAKVDYSQELTSFEAFSLLDDIYFHQAHKDSKFINLDLSPMLNLIKEKHGNRFYWKSFISDFKEELIESMTGDFKFSFYGAQNIMLFINRKNLDSDFQTLKFFLNDFSYFKYFEDTTILISNSDKPVLTTTAPSSINFLRQIETKEIVNRIDAKPSINSPVFNV